MYLSYDYSTSIRLSTQVMPSTYMWSVCHLQFILSNNLLPKILTCYKSPKTQ